MNRKGKYSKHKKKQNCIIGKNGNKRKRNSDEIEKTIESFETDSVRFI